MSKKPTTKTGKSAKPAPDAAATDKARAEALAKLNAKPAAKPARGAKPDNWENDPLESDAALEAALTGTNPATSPATTPPTIARGAKSAKGGTNAKAAKGSPTAERGATGGKTAKGGKDAKAPKAKPSKPSKPTRLSALDAAAKVLAESDRPLRAIDMIEVMHGKGLWTSPGGRTPEATLYAAITREIAAKGKDARFKKVDRGMFTASASKTGKGA